MSNYFLLLELPYYPAENKESVILDRIEEKKRFWTQNINHYQKSAIYRHYIQLIPDIKHRMLDKSLREQEAKEAIKYVYNKLDPYFKMMAVSKTFCEEEIELIEEHSHLNKDIIIQHMGYYNISLGIKSLPPEHLRIAYKNMPMQTSDYWKKIYEDEYEKKPISAEKYQLMEDKLKIFGVEDYYEFLEISEKEKIGYQPFMLYAQVQKIEKEKFKKNDMESAVGRQICSSCYIAFENTQTKQEYDKYIEWKEKKNLLNFVQRIAKVKENILLESQCDFIVKQLEKIVGNAESAKRIFSAFCEVEKIMYSFSDLEKEKGESFVDNLEDIESTMKDEAIEAGLEGEKIKKKSKIKIVIGIIFAIILLRFLYIISISVMNSKYFEPIEISTIDIDKKTEKITKEKELVENNIIDDNSIEDIEQNVYEEDTYETEEDNSSEVQEYEEEIEEYNEQEEYIFPDSDTKKLTVTELRKLGKKRLRIARNEIYARHGRKFLSQDLQEYFNSYSWYCAEYDPDEFKESWLSKKEKYNIKLILRYEKKMGYQ